MAVANGQNTPSTRRGGVWASAVGIIGSVALLGYLGSRGAPLVPNFTQPEDPNLFALNWDLVAEVLLTIVILAFLVERALALLFESRWFVALETRRGDKGAYKPLIAFAVGALGCILWRFDAISIILVRESWTVLGAVITGGVIAGGSKASLKLFHDVLEIKSSAVVEREALQQQTTPKRPKQPAGNAG